MPMELQSGGLKVVPVKTKDASGRKTMAEYIKRDDALQAVTDCWEKDFGCRPAVPISAGSVYGRWSLVLPCS